MSLRLTPAGRIGLPVALSKSNRDVLVCTKSKTMCVHGERPASLLAWMASERADPTFKRPSVCDCQNLDGLLTDYKGSCPFVPDVRMTTLYKALGEIGTEEIVVCGRPQRLAIDASPSSGQIWIQPAGTVVCQHGNTRKMIAAMANPETARRRKNDVTVCDCKLVIPRRQGSVFSKREKRCVPVKQPPSVVGPPPNDEENKE